MSSEELFEFIEEEKNKEKKSPRNKQISSIFKASWRHKTTESFTDLKASNSQNISVYTDNIFENSMDIQERMSLKSPESCRKTFL